MVIDGKEFKCTQCGDCCKWDGFVILTEEDIDRLRHREHLSLDQFKDDFVKEKNLKGTIVEILKSKKGTTECIYLKDNKCSVYEIKPKQCSEYPKHFDEECEGFDTGEKVMNSKYELAVKNMNKRLAGDMGEKSIIANLFSSLDKNKGVTSVIAKAMDSGIDVYLKDEKVKIASLADLYAFTRVDDNHLVHKATKDLWSLEAGDDGSITINRLFDGSGNPIRS